LEEQRLDVFETRVLREVTGNWRKLHSEELHDFYAYQKLFGTSLQRRIIGAVRVERVGEKRNT
jgi:hypothetical protein